MTTFKSEYDMIKIHEGCINFMYLDSKNNVTVGIGKLLAKVEDAYKLWWKYKSNGKYATRDDILKDFEYVKEHPDHAASYYENITSLYLEDDEIIKLTERQISIFQEELMHIFPDYKEWPEAARWATLDMIYNLGKVKLVYGFPHFCRAAKNHDWKECANQCHRKGISDERNNDTRTLFLNCS